MSVVAKRLNRSIWQIGMEVGLGPGHIVLDGDPAPCPQKRGHSLPIFGPCLLWQNGWMDQDATWYHGGRPRPRPHCSTWGPSFPSPEKGRSPKFSASVCCGQMAEWIEIPLRTEVGLGPDHVVLDGDPAPPHGCIKVPLGTKVVHGDPAPPQTGHSPPIFGPCLLWPNGRPSQLLLSTCLSLMWDPTWR